MKLPKLSIQTVENLEEISTFGEQNLSKTIKGLKVTNHVMNIEINPVGSQTLS